ncbi:MAG TPA: BamA/TamA family outer membrane protein, partial [Vicinamibacteria bacterium]
APEKPGFLERQVLALEKAERPGLLNLQYRGFFPVFTSISAGSRLAAGLRYWQPERLPGHTSLHASAAFSPTGYELYDLQLGRIPHRAGRRPERSTRGDDVYELGSRRPGASGLILYGSLRHRHNPQERFFGLGPESRLQDRSSYLLREGSGELVGGYQLGARTVATLRAGLFRPGVGPGESDDFPSAEALFDERAAPGLTRQRDYLRLAGLLLHDARDRPFNPHRGGMIALSALRFEGRGGGEFDFTRMALDARGYLSLGSPQRVLALRALASADDPAPGARVPFYLQEALANSHTLRGFETFRFRGEKLLSLQAEYRWEAVPALELAAFVDTGAVAASGQDFGALEAGYGLGLRVKTAQDVLARLDAAWSREGHRVYLRFGHAF